MVLKRVLLHSDLIAGKIKFYFMDNNYINLVANQLFINCFVTVNIAFNLKYLFSVIPREVEMVLFD